MRGSQYIFNQNNASNSNHPLALSITSNGIHGGGTQYTSWVYSGIAGSNGIATFTVPYNSPENLYYYCQNHSGMGGLYKLRIVKEIKDKRAIKVLREEKEIKVKKGDKGQKGDKGIKGEI